MHIEPLTGEHDRGSFTCGEQEVDDFFHFEALKGKDGYSWVVVPEPGSKRVIAFYTIDPDPVIGIEDDEYGEYPVGLVLLQMLGVDKAYMGQGIGTRLLMRMIKQVLLVATHRSISGILLMALNQKAKDWYLQRNLGFREIAPESMRLLLPVATMRMLPEVADLGLPPEGF